MSLEQEHSTHHRHLIHRPRIHERPFALVIVGLIVGIFFVIQARSFEKVSFLATRDSASNIFREIQVFYKTNQQLKSQIAELEKNLLETKDRSTSLQALEKEILQNQLASGSVGVIGPGIIVSMPEKTAVPWMIDLVNEFFGIGAEAVSVNRIRITNQTAGFDGLPQGKILLNGNILEPPYLFAAIGEPEVLSKALLQPNGFIKRYKQFHNNITPILEKREKIEMEKII